MNNGRIEQALYITRKDQVHLVADEHTRLYFGNEFCQQLIPRRRDLEEVLEFAASKELGFTFLTPYVTDAGLHRLDNLLAIVASARPGSEVVFNDWGVLSMLQDDYPTLAPVMGRLLNKMKRGPRLLNFLDITTRETLESFRSCSLDVPELQRFLRENNVRRVELDNPLQGISLDFRGTGLRASICYPYAYVTTTRFCLANGCEDPERTDDVSITGCSQECRRYAFKLDHPVMPVSLIRKGNSQFVRNDRLSPDLEMMGIDRIVHEPELPL